jgi:hypothetical protein
MSDDDLMDAIRAIGMSVEEAAANWVRAAESIAAAVRAEREEPMKKTGKFIVEWVHDGESSSIRVSPEGTRSKDLPRNIKEMIADTLLRDLSAAGELHIHVG